MRQKQMIAVIVASLGVFWGADAFAQQGVITLDDTVIKGRIQKPEAFYILQHANLNYESLEIKPSFVEELKKTVKEDPF